MAEVTFGEWLKRRRGALGLTQEQLAQQVGCSTIALRKIEAEERRPSEQIGERLAEVFKIVPEERKSFLRFARGDWRSAPSLFIEEAPWRVSTASPRSNLPVPLTSFIGREKEIDEIILLSDRNRLVTLTGPGGVGKTRLAIRSSNQMLNKFKDGVWWVELAPLIDDALVLQAVARALGVRESSSQPLAELLKNLLREKRLLLVLDNCEHLITACAQLANELLTQCANLKILATSRETLGITGEMVYEVPGLSLPKSQHLTLTDLLLEYEGIRLFVERACAVTSDFALTEQNAAAVLQICQRLDGISLALELAAARTRLLSVEQIAERLNDRFHLLTQGSRTALPRHQTMRAAIDWSYDLLSQPEQSFFNRLSVFAGGFTLDAAAEVAAGGDVSRSQVTDLLGQLINKSLVTVEARSGDIEAVTRYGMLETIREYAREKLDESGETERLRQRHRDFFIALVEQAAQKLKSAEQFAWLDRLELEHDNLRVAWDCAIASDAESALRLASPLLDFWFMRGNRNEGREWLAKLLPRTNQWGNTAKRAQSLGVAGRLAYLEQDFAAARSLLEEAVPIARISGDQKEIAFALLWLGLTAYRQHDDQTARAFLEECLTIYQGLQAPWEIAWAISVSGDLAYYQGHYAEATERYTKSLAKFQELGDKFMVGRVLNALGEISRLLGDYERAGKFYEQDIEILRELRSPFTLAGRVINLAWVSLHGGDYRKARILFEDSLSLFEEYGNKNAMTDCLTGFAGILVVIGKPERAAQLFGAVESSFESIGRAGRMDPPDQKEFGHYVAAVRAQLDEATFAKAWAEGRALTLEQAIEFALLDPSE